MTNSNSSYLNKTDIILMLMIPLCFAIGIIGLKINQDPIEQVGYFAILAAFLLIPIFTLFQLKKVDGVLLKIALFCSTPIAATSMCRFLHWDINVLHILFSVLILVLVLIYLIKVIPNLFSSNKLEFSFIFILTIHNIYFTLTYAIHSLPVYKSAITYYSINLIILIAGIALSVSNQKSELRTLLVVALLYPLFVSLKLLLYILPPYS